MRRTLMQHEQTIRKISREGMFRYGDTMTVRDGEGRAVETWRAVSVRPFSKRSQTEEVLFSVRGYRDTSSI